MKRYRLVLGLLAVQPGMLAMLASAATINVSPGAGTLQSAHDSATAGDTLVLADGTYTGSGTEVLQIGKHITIQAANAGKAILDGENARNGITTASAPTVIITGLSVTKCTEGFSLSSGTSTINSCQVYDNTQGVFIMGSGPNTFNNCDIFRNGNAGAYMHFEPAPLAAAKHCPAPVLRASRWLWQGGQGGGCSKWMEHSSSTHAESTRTARPQEAA